MTTTRTAVAAALALSVLVPAVRMATVDSPTVLAPAAQTTTEQPYVYTGDTAETEPVWNVETQETAIDCTPLTWAAFEAAVEAGDMHPSIWGDLMAIGWVGHADDGMEAIYHPSC